MISRDGSTDSTDFRGERCATRFPLLLVHGVGVRDGKRGRIWGRIPQVLREQGAKVYLGGQDGWGAPESNAAQLRKKLDMVLNETGERKVNIIAHSKGGLDVRYLIALLMKELRDNALSEAPSKNTQCKLQEKELCEDTFSIASFTTIATPHHGSRTLDVLFSHFRPVFTPLALVMNPLFRVLGDDQPNFRQACEQLTSSYMHTWNDENPLPHSLYSQQFGSSLNSPRESLISFATYPVVNLIEGPNDGLVALESAAYNNFCGRLQTLAGAGISHAGLVDISRRPFAKHRPKKHLPVTQTVESAVENTIPLVIGDILEFYVTLVADLKTRGF